jgi:hypothetical protein
MSYSIFGLGVELAYINGSSALRLIMLAFS